jgi:8-oxo-dGTP diphosphatase
VSAPKKRLFPIVTADVALFTLTDHQLRVLLIKLANNPTPGGWALPGSVLKPDLDRNVDDTALRALASKTRVVLPHLEQVTTSSGADRDPRGWSVSVLYYALLPSDQVPAVAGDKTEAIEWCNPERPGHRLSFDHAQLLERALATLRDKVERGALPLHLLPGKFTLTDLQRACEAILGRELDKGAFRRKIADQPTLVPVRGEFLRGPQRPAQLYRAATDFRLLTN